MAGKKTTGKTKETTGKAVRPRHVVEWEGEEYDLAPVGPGRSTTPEEKVAIADLVCKMYATNRYPLDKCLDYCGINSHSTWWRWMDEIAEIAKLYKDAQSIQAKTYKTGLKERARTMAERAITGFTRKLRTKEQVNVLLPGNGYRVTDKDGNPIEIALGADGKPNETLVTTRYLEKEIFVRPSASLIQYVLNNTDPTNFQSNPDPEDLLDDDFSIPPIDWIE